jgi:dTDP-4-amino-4,6-dideoxygalactose transaminase
MSPGNGSRPPRETFLPFSPPMIGEAEKKELLDTLDSGWITKGPKTELFEEAFAAYCGVPHAVGVHSCTAALHLSLLAVGVSEGDEVIVPTMTFASTAHAVLYCRATPVFADCDPRTFNVTADLVADKITPRTKAIIPMHYGGLCCDMEGILELAQKYDLRVIEDAAHAAGSAFGTKRIGGLKSDAACFSFYATKNMTTGEGGMVTSHDPDIIEKVRVLSMYGISDARRIWKRYAPRGSWSYDVGELGYKYNMMDIQAALGIHQLKQLDGFIERRQQFAEAYNKGFAGITGVSTPADPDSGCHARHLYPLLINPERLTIDRDTFIEKLSEHNIGTSVLWIPLHMHSYYEKLFGHRIEDFPNSLYLFERVINLPISPIMSDDDVADVISVVRDIAEAHAC